MGILEKIFDMVVQFTTEQKKTNELLEQIITQPLLTAAPATYPIVKAAQNSLKEDWFPF